MPQNNDIFFVLGILFFVVGLISYEYGWNLRKSMWFGEIRAGVIFGILGALYVFLSFFFLILYVVDLLL